MNSIYVFPREYISCYGQTVSISYLVQLVFGQGDPQKVPKAILHQLCQKSGWEAPKFNKILGRGKSFSYTVSILRKASGRGKNRKAGGLVTLKLPDQNEIFESAEVSDSYARIMILWFRKRCERDEI